ncbi:MAG TPA: hypothetical protein VKV18_05260 [Chthonomonas sp.]|uniref:hypothetical protein n=1 Tax=Chthonomonas sp. TaxID=2282153 RepID=UPI002B4AC40E|nr:hypothetical protein [Chthonomonas sp.]HLI48084.1 hypothetical protein [Chthonomonas sp.]
MRQSRPLINRLAHNLTPFPTLLWLYNHLTIEIPKTQKSLRVWQPKALRRA